MSSASVDPALVLRRRAIRRAEGRRRLAVVLGVVAALLLPAGYWGLEHSSVFAASRVVVAGGSAGVDAQVRSLVAAEITGKSLLQVDASALAARLEAMPVVRSARVDRAFPHTVAVTVVMERPVAFVRAGKAGYVVSADGRVLRALSTAPKHLAKLMLPAGPPVPPGHTIETAPMGAALTVLTAAPNDFPVGIARIKGVSSGPGGVVATFGHHLHIRLGDTTRLGLKLRVAALVLSKMGDSIRRSVAYVDVSSPARPTIGYKK
jgi:cell division protein FtsQ